MIGVIRVRVIDFAGASEWQVVFEKKGEAEI